MNKNNNEILTENVIRIRDEELRERLNNIYQKFKDDYYPTKNVFFKDILSKGVAVIEKVKEDNWAIQHSRDTLLDAMHEHTKRMNYFIKFSKPFIKSCFANNEIILGLVLKIYNYLLSNVPLNEREKLIDLINIDKYIPESYRAEKKRLMDLYDYKVD